MYVKFLNIKFRNILSYGNDDTVVDFQTGMTLISARSGSGKSTLIDALSFCLYGKPYRKIKINDLVNRRNKKKLYTECRTTSLSLKVIYLCLISPKNKG
jgi:DNA repair exonuclease SbcCD ATPase subunit